MGNRTSSVRAGYRNRAPGRAFQPASDYFFFSGLGDIGGQDSVTGSARVCRCVAETEGGVVSNYLSVKSFVTFSFKR